jgi:hypothetical protein
MVWHQLLLHLCVCVAGPAALTAMLLQVKAAELLFATLQLLSLLLLPGGKCCSICCCAVNISARRSK